VRSTQRPVFIGPGSDGRGGENRFHNASPFETAALVLSLSKSKAGACGIFHLSLTSARQYARLMRQGWLIAVAIAIAPLAAAPAAEAEDQPSREVRFVELPPVSVPLVQGSAIQGSFFVHFNLAVETEAARDAIAKQQPRLEAAYLESLSLLAQYHLDPDRAVNLPPCGGEAVPPRPATAPPSPREWPR